MPRRAAGDMIAAAVVAKGAATVAVATTRASWPDNIGGWNLLSHKYANFFS